MEETTMRIIIESFIGGIFGALRAALASFIIAAMAAATYFVVRIFASMTPYDGSSPAKISSIVSDTVSFTVWSVEVLCCLGALLGFANSFSKISNRRSSLKDFIPR